MGRKQRIIILLLIFAAAIWYHLPSDDWKLAIHDDAFSAGKQATMLVKSDTSDHTLILDCSTKYIRLSFGIKGKLPTGVVGFGELSTRIDKSDPIVFHDVLWKTDGDYIFAQTFVEGNPSEFALFLHQLKDAKSNVIVGFKGLRSDSSAENTSSEFGVVGVRDTLEKFEQACKISIKITPK